MKKLLFFVSDYQIGVSSLLTDQVVSLARCGANVIVVGGDKEQEPGLIKRLRSNQIKLYTVQGLDAHSNFQGLATQLKELILKENIEVVHVQNNWQLALIGAVRLRSLFKTNFKIIYTLHGFRNNHLLKAVVAQGVIGIGLFVFANKVICMSDFLKGKFKFLSYKILKLPLGVKQDFFDSSYVQPSKSVLSLIYPAQFRKGKNQETVIRAFNSYVKATRDKSAILTLPGDGDGLESAKALVRDMGIDRRVRFPGRVSRETIKELYLQSNLAIVASDSETFGQCIAEPYVLGRPIITTKVGIAPEIIETGVNGYFFDSEASLTSILLYLNEHRDMINSMGKSNYSGREKFSWPQISSRYIRLLLK